MSRSKRAIGQRPQMSYTRGYVSLELSADELRQIRDALPPGKGGKLSLRDRVELARQWAEGWEELED